MSDDAEFKAIFTGDNSQFKASIDESLAYVTKLANGVYDFGTTLQNPVEMLQKFNKVNAEIAANISVNAIREMIAAATDLSPILARISEFTGINFQEAGINATTFGKGLSYLSDASLVSTSALASIAQQLGQDNPTLLEYAKAIQLITADLSSFTEKSTFFSAAQAALKDPIQVAALAMQQFDTKIVDTGARLISLVESLDLTKIKFTDVQSYVESIAKAYTHAEAAIASFVTTNSGNNVAIELGINRLQQYLAIVEEARNRVRSYIEAQYENGNATQLFVKNTGEAIEKSRMLSTEIGAMTKVFLSADSILNALNSTMEISVRDVLSLMEANRSNNVVYKELLSLLPELTTATGGLTNAQKLLAQLLEDIATQYGAEFVSIFQAIVAQLNLTEQSLLMLYSRFVTTAQAITQLLSQAERLVGMFITQTQSQDTATLSLEKQASVIMQVIEWYAKFKTELLSITSIQNAMVGEQNAQTQALLTYEGVLNSATGVYDTFLSSSRALMVVQQQATQVTKESFDPVERLALAKERLRSSLGPLIDGFSTLISTLKSFAVFTAASAIISGITDAFHSVISSASDFDQTLHSLKAITGSTSNEMIGMNDVIKNMASNSTYSIEAIGKGLQNMAQAGFTVEESANAIQAATNLAMGTLEKLENTVDLVTSTLVSYGLNSLEAGRVSDVLATAVNQSKLSIDGLRTSLNYVGVIAAQSGLSLQETTASLMTLADRGMKASTMGTGLRQVLDKLIAPNEKLRDAYQAHGIELDKISPLTAGYETALKNLSTALWDADTQTVNTSKAFELFGIRGAQAAAILIQTYVSGEWKDALNSLNESGTAAKMAAEQMEGLSSKWEKLQAKVSALSASLGEGGLVTAMKAVVLVLTTMVDGFQAFLDKDFGMWGTVTELIITFAGSVTLGVVAIKAALIAWEALVAASLALYLGIGKATEALRLFYATLLANKILAIGVAIATVIALLQTYNANIQEGIDKHNKLAKEANQAANALELFQQVIKKIGGDSDKLVIEINRLKSEFPELVSEIENVAGVTDISTLSYKELNSAMQEVQNLKLIKALTEYTSAFYEMDEASRSAQSDMQGISERGYDITESMGVTEKAIEQLTNTLKNIGKTLIEQGHQVEGSLVQQREAALDALNVYLNANTKMESSRSALTKIILDNFDKEDQRLQRSKEFNQKQFNDIGQFYKDLSALERAEIQSTFEEQRKAEEKLKKMQKDGLISEEELQASLYATKLRYVDKEFALLDDNRKKQYETSLEKYNREIQLLDKEIAYKEKSLQEQKALMEKFSEFGEKLNDKQLTQMNSTYQNIETATESLEQKRREKSKVTYEYQKQIADDFLKTVQANLKLQLSVTEGFETERLKIEQKGAEAALQLIQKRIDAENDRFTKSLQGNVATEQQMLEHTERMKTLINDEVNARAEAITKTVALGQDLVNQLQEQMNKDLETTKSIYQSKSDIAKQHYDNILFTAQNALTKEYEEITKKNRNEEVVDDLKLQAKIKFWDKSLELTVQASEEESRIRQEEFEKSKAIIDQKLQVQIDYMAKVKGLWDTQSQYATVTEQQQLESAQRLMTEQETLMKGHTSTFQSESGKRIQTIIDEAAVAGQSIQDQVNEHGIAYVKMTGVTAEELRKQQVDFITTKDGIFQVITQQTLAVQDAAVKETKAYKDAIAEKEAKSIEFVQSEIKRLETLLGAVKKELQDELSEHSKIVDEIKKVRESIVKIHEKVADEINKINQTTMTDEKKYYDNIRIANEALNKARSTGIKEYVDDAWSKVTGLATGTIKLDNGTQLSAEQTASLKKRMVKEWEEVATKAQKEELKRLEDNKKALEELMAKTQEKIDATMTKLKEFEQLEIKLNTDKFTVAIEDIMKGIDSVIAKLQSIAKEAPVNIDISEFNLTIEKAKGGVAQLKTDVEKIKDAKGNIDITAGKDQVPIDDFLTLAKGSLKAFEQYVKTDLKPVVETAFKATGYENKSIDEAVTAIKESVKTLKEGDGSIDSVKPELNVNAQMNGVTETASTIVKGVEDIKTKLGEIPKETKSKHDIAVTGVADLQAAIDKHSQLDGVETHSYHTVHVTTVNDGGGEGEAGNQRTGGYISARVGGFIQSLKSGGAFTGKLPGYGGGDIVNARLEPGEFVMRKEAVQNIGVNALRQWNNLNSSAQKSLNPNISSKSSDSVFSGQLHTINLNIGGQDNIVYAPTDSLSNLTTSLRRARMMRA